MSPHVMASQRLHYSQASADQGISHSSTYRDGHYWYRKFSCGSGDLDSTPDCTYWAEAYYLGKKAA